MRVCRWGGKVKGVSERKRVEGGWLEGVRVEGARLGGFR